MSSKAYFAPALRRSAWLASALLDASVAISRIAQKSTRSDAEITLAARNTRLSIAVNAAAATSAPRQRSTKAPASHIVSAAAARSANKL